MSRIPSTMVPPSQKRPHIWKQGILQIFITRACDLACFHCTQGSNLRGKPVLMTVEQFEQACLSLKDYFGVVGIFGGNPTLHPQFDEICKVMKGIIPWERRGLWTNNLNGKGKVCQTTFNPAHSNLNVHLVREAYDEMYRDWPEARLHIKGLDPSWPEARGREAHIVGDSRHSSPYVAMKDVIQDENERLELIGKCDVNQNWSAMIGVFRGELRAWFCEIAGAQSMLHQNNPDYPDTGLPVEPGWWKRPMQDFAEQVNKHCHECGIPLRSYGQLAVGGDREQVSSTHAQIYLPKKQDRLVELVVSKDQLNVGALPRATDYIQNGGI